MTWSPLVAALALSLAAGAAADESNETSPPVSGPAAERERATVALLKLEANSGGADQAPAVASLLGSRLAESAALKVITQSEVATMVGMDRVKTLLSGDTCNDSCMVELSGALGARYVVSGRVDRFGDAYAVTAVLFDSKTSTSLAKPRAEAASDAGLPAAARAIADALLTALGTSAGDKGAALAASRGFVLTLKGGSAFFASLAALSPGGDLELGYRFHPEWIAFVQVGFKLFTGDAEDGGSGNVQLVPSVLGVRHLYRVDASLQPYWGLGLGIQLAFGELGPFTRTGALPTVIGMGGVQYLFTDHFGALVELSTNVAQALLGVASGGQISGLNFALAAGITYRF